MGFPILAKKKSSLFSKNIKILSTRKNFVNKNAIKHEKNLGLGGDFGPKFWRFQIIIKKCWRFFGDFDTSDWRFEKKSSGHTEANFVFCQFVNCHWGLHEVKL